MKYLAHLFMHCWQEQTEQKTVQREENISHLKSLELKHYLEKLFMLTSMTLVPLIENLSGMIKAILIDDKASLRYARRIRNIVKLTPRRVVEIIEAGIVLL